MDLFTPGGVFKSCRVVKKTQAGTHRSSRTQKCCEGFVGFNPSLLVTWTFSLVLLKGVNPLIALNQFNSEVFIVFHRLCPHGSFCLITQTDLKW